MAQPIQALLRSRKFLLALFGVLQAVASHYLDIPDDVWQSITVLVMVLITAIAVEDAAAKRAGAAPTGHPSESTTEEA